MRKLKLESLSVESFDTTTAAPAARGTVLGNDVSDRDAPSLCRLCPVSGDLLCNTDSPEACGDTNYLDCTFVCSDFASCVGDC